MNDANLPVAARPLVVVVEDDAAIRQFLKTGLHAHGFDVVDADTGALGLSLASARNPDLVILDLGLPDIDGVDVVKQLRHWSSVPVIALSARSHEPDKVDMLEAGADDYMTKPFGLIELVTRIRVALRRIASATRRNASGVFTLGALNVDLLRNRVYRGGELTYLTRLEYRLLTTLISHAGRVMTHRQLMTAVWGIGHVDKSHYLRIYMGTLRRKLEADPARPQFLITEPGTGYRLATEAFS
jgi:two-component system KDP operon response regulator KdpE